MQQYISSNKLKQTAALTALIALGLFLLYALHDLLVGTLGAVILYVLFKPIMQYLLLKKPNKKGFFAFLIILSTFIIILLPLGLCINVIYTKFYSMLYTSDVNMQQISAQLKSTLGIDILADSTIQSVKEKAAAILPGLLGGTASLALDIAIMYFILYYMLVNTGRMENGITKMLPISVENAKLFYKELEMMTFSNVLVVPLIAVAQGVISAVIFWIAGVNDAGFLGFLSAILSFVPFVGTALVWLPVGIYQLATGHVWQGVLIITSGLLLITHIDNVLRLLIQKRFGNVHPLVTVLGIIAGLNLFSLPGVIFGPLLISYFLIFLKMYQKEYLNAED